MIRSRRSHVNRGTFYGVLCTQNISISTCNTNAKVTFQVHRSSKTQINFARRHDKMDEAQESIKTFSANGNTSISTDGIKNSQKPESNTQPLVWFNIIIIAVIHSTSIYYLSHMSHMKLLTVAWVFIANGIGIFGITAGAHRLWCHRTYKAKLPLQLILLFCYATAGHYSLLHWIRDHRVHHKFTDTDADPHNSKRGFFFSHVGWLMQKKHPEVVRKGKLVDLSDITGDPLLAFYNKYFIFFRLLLGFFIPVTVPVYGWNETWKYAIASQAFIRYTLSLNITWTANSVAHKWGQKPYNNKITSTENASVAFVTLGEGWHNYHHVFPWDYKTAEFGDYKLNITTMWLDLFAKIGWAYDMKTPSKQLVQKVVQQYGDNRMLEEIPCDEFDDKSK